MKNTAYKPRMSEIIEIGVAPKHSNINPKKIQKVFKSGDLRYIWTLNRLYILRIHAAPGFSGFPGVPGKSQNIPHMSLLNHLETAEPELVDMYHIAVPSDKFWVFGPWYKQGDYAINAVSGLTEKMMGDITHVTDTQITFRIVERVYAENGVFKTPHGNIRLGTLKFERDEVISDRGTLLRDCLELRVYKYERMTFIWCKTRKGKYEDCWDTCIHNKDGRFLFNIYNDPIYDVHGMWLRDRRCWGTIFNTTSDITSTEPVWWANAERVECFPR